MSFQDHSRKTVKDVRGAGAAEGGARAAYAHEPHPGVARVSVHGLGVTRVRRRRDVDRERGLAAGDDGRPEGGRDQPGAGGRPQLRCLARPRQRPLGEADRDAAGVRLRRVDGRLGARLRVQLGRRDGFRHAQRDPVPQPGLHGRCDVSDRHRREGRRRPGDERGARHGRRRHGHAGGNTMAKGPVEVRIPKEEK